MFYDKQTKRKIQLLNLLIALLILIPIVLDFSKGFTIGFNSSFIGFENGLGKSSLQISTIKRLRLLSYYMIAFYFISYIDPFIATAYYRSHLDLGGYTICYPELSPSVTIAFILLLLAEILNIAHKQREELDLTI